MVQKEKSETKHKKDYHKILQTITADLLQKRLYTDPTSLLLIDCRHPELFEKSNIITSLNVHITKHNKGITPQQIEDEFTRYEYKIFFRQREFLHIVMYEQSVPQGRTIPKSSSAYRLYKILRQEGLAKEIFILKGGFDEFVKKFGSFCNGKNDLVISSPLTENQEECTTAKCKKKCNQVAQLIPTITQQIIDLKYSKAHTITLEERIQIAHKKLFSSFKTNLTCELPSMIFEHLYLGNIHNSVNYAQLNQLGIKYILNCAKECKNKFRDSLTYLKCSLIDEETADIAQYFDQCFQFIGLYFVDNYF